MDHDHHEKFAQKHKEVLAFGFFCPFVSISSMSMSFVVLFCWVLAFVSVLYGLNGCVGISAALVLNGNKDSFFCYWFRWFKEPSDQMVSSWNALLLQVWYYWLPDLVFIYDNDFSSVWEGAFWLYFSWRVANIGFIGIMILHYQERIFAGYYLCCPFGFLSWLNSYDLRAIFVTWTENIWLSCTLLSARLKREKNVTNLLLLNWLKDGYRGIITHIDHNSRFADTFREWGVSLNLSRKLIVSLIYILNYYTGLFIRKLWTSFDLWFRGSCWLWEKGFEDELYESRLANVVEIIRFSGLLFIVWFLWWRVTSFVFLCIRAGSRRLCQIKSRLLVLHLNLVWGTSVFWAMCFFINLGSLHTRKIAQLSTLRLNFL